MTNYANDPVYFRGESFVTDTLDGKTPDLGAVLHSGGREYVWVYNGCNSDLPPGIGLVPMSDASNYSLSLTSVTSADLLVGIVRNCTLTTGAYGWVVRRGITNIEMGGTSATVAAHGLCELAADGVFVTISNTTGNFAPAVVKALTAIVSNASGEAYVSCF